MESCTKVGGHFLFPFLFFLFFNYVCYGDRHKNLKSRPSSRLSTSRARQPPTKDTRQAAFFVIVEVSRKTRDVGEGIGRSLQLLLRVARR